MSISQTLLLVTHVPLRQSPQGLQIDDQTAQGIAQWARHFDHVTYCGMLLKGNEGATSTTWVSLPPKTASKVTLVGLPLGYRFSDEVRHRKAVRLLLREQIDAHQHLCFTLGSMRGDWPSLGANEAIRKKRRFAAWIDRVESSVLLDKLKTASLPKRMAGRLLMPAIEFQLRRILKRAAVSLLQGADTFEYYARATPNPHCTYDTHTQAGDQLTPQALIEKQARVRSSSPIRILYVGRAAAMKGPFDWLEVLKKLHTRGINFQAKWVGDGPDLAEMRRFINKNGLAHKIELPGFEGRRDALFAMMRDSDILMFCHKTPESPRSLIESLVAGCPIVGYGSAYPRGLVAMHGGGAFVAQNDIGALVSQMAALASDRSALAKLITCAAASGQLYSEDRVYSHRAELMKLG